MGQWEGGHTIFALDLSDVRDLLGIQQRRDARHQILAKGGVAGEDVRVSAFLDVLDEEGRIIFREALVMRCE